MQRLVIAIVFLGCGGPARPSAPPPSTSPPRAGSEHYVFAQRHGAHVTAFELRFDGDRVTLFDGTTTYRGTRRGNELSLTTPDMQPLAMHCERKPIDAAAPGDDCSAPRDRHLDALVCSAPGQTGAGADADADDQLVFAVAPGVEYVEAACGGGLHQRSPVR